VAPTQDAANDLDPPGDYRGSAEYRRALAAVLAGAPQVHDEKDSAGIAAEVLGVAVDDIVVYAADTDLTPFDVGAYASGTTYITGMAAKQAAEAARARIAQRAARMLGLGESSPIELRDHQAWASDGRSVSLADVALHVLHAEDQEQILGTASYLARESPAPFAAQAAEVEVDVDTGQVTVSKFVTAVDCGVPINPLTASGQVEGGVLMALGYALCEELVLDGDGRPVNAKLGPYWIYRADDAPATEVFLIQTNEPSGPFGAKAVGEIPTVGVAPAVRNAILDATGVALNVTPFTPSACGGLCTRPEAASGGHDGGSGSSKILPRALSPFLDAPCRSSVPANNRSSHGKRGTPTDRAGTVPAQPTRTARSPGWRSIPAVSAAVGSAEVRCKGGSLCEPWASQAAPRWAHRR
jgi:hypothetical protein